MNGQLVTELQALGYLVTELQALRRFLAAYLVCDASRGRFSCTDMHDMRCLKARGILTAECECGSDELEAVLAALEGQGYVVRGPDMLYLNPEGYKP